MNESICELMYDPESIAIMFAAGGGFGTFKGVFKGVITRWVPLHKAYLMLILGH